MHAFQVTIEDDGDGTMSHFVQPAVRLARRSCPGARVRIAGFGACWLNIAVQVKVASIRSYEELPEFLEGIGCRCRRPLKEVCAGALGRVGASRRNGNRLCRHLPANPAHRQILKM